MSGQSLREMEARMESQFCSKMLRQRSHPKVLENQAYDDRQKGQYPIREVDPFTDLDTTTQTCAQVMVLRYISDEKASC